MLIINIFFKGIIYSPEDILDSVSLEIQHDLIKTEVPIFVDILRTGGWILKVYICLESAL